MGTDELESLLTSTSLDEIIAAINDPAVRTRHGWDLRGWTYSLAPSSVCFLHYDENGHALDMVVAVRAPRKRRDRLNHLIADFPLPARLVLID